MFRSVGARKSCQPVFPVSRLAAESRKILHARGNLMNRSQPFQSKTHLPVRWRIRCKLSLKHWEPKSNGPEPRAVRLCAVQGDRTRAVAPKRGSQCELPRNPLTTASTDDVDHGIVQHAVSIHHVIRSDLAYQSIWMCSIHSGKFRTHRFSPATLGKISAALVNTHSLAIGRAWSYS